jgi:Ca2+-transporting ATPase
MYAPISSSKALIPGKMLLMTLLQGLILTAVCVLTAYFVQSWQMGEASVRTAVFFTLIFGNVFLTLYNRSDVFTIFSGKLSRNRMVYWIIGITLSILAIIGIFKPLQELLSMDTITFRLFITALMFAMIGTVWIEIRKFLIYRKN